MSFAQKLLDPFFGDKVFRAFPNNLAANFSYFSFQFSDTKFIRIFNYLFDSLISELNHSFSSTFFDLERNKMVSSDFKLLFTSVTRNLDKLKSIEKRSCHFQSVGCADKHHLWKVNRDADVVIYEWTVLRWV